MRRHHLLLALLCGLEILQGGSCQNTPYGDDCTHLLECMQGAKCVNPFHACYSQNFTDEKTSVYTCMNITSPSRTVAEPACIGVPEPPLRVTVEQATNDNRTVILTVRWTPSPKYVGPVRYYISSHGTFKRPFSHYGQILASHASDDNNNNYIDYENVTGGWTYNIYVAAVTAAGPSPPYGPVKITAMDTIPNIVKDLKVVQDSYIASKMTLSIEIPQIPHGIITELVVRKTVTVANVNRSTEYPIPFTDVYSFYQSVDSSELGGITVHTQYYFEVKIRNAHFDGEYSDAVSFVAEERKPILAPLSLLVSPNAAPSSFNLKLGASYLMDQSQGVVKKAVLILCDKKIEGTSCQSSYVNPVGEPSEIRIEKPGDIKSCHTWAYAKARNFAVPYCTTEDDWHTTLERDNSTDFTYVVGGNHCDESDNQTLCNGPLPKERDFIVTVVVCNDAGCSEENFENQKFSTRAVSEGDDHHSTVVGLGVCLALALLLCLVLAFIILRRRQRM